MGSFSVAAAVLCATLLTASAQDSYPQNPILTVTPGSYCTHPDTYRYPEHIPYCNRDVKTGEKWKVINEYNKLGFKIDDSNRNQFKIDHLIPLCMGGSNEIDNLWPQHQTVYVITDPLEGVACEKMADGKLLQKHAVELLMQAKMHLDQAPEILKELQAL
jgi:hypothetical protein